MEVGSFAEKFERKKLVAQHAVQPLGPRPVEVRRGLETPERSGRDATVQAAFLALGFFPLEQYGEPGLLLDLVPRGHHAVQAKRAGTATLRVRVGGSFAKGHEGFPDGAPSWS